MTAGKIVLGALGAAGILAVNKLADKLAEKVVTETPKKVIDFAKLAMQKAQGTNLISYSQAARVEPILLLDDRATYVPFVQDTIHTMFALFTGYYLQSIAMDTTLNGVKVIKRLEQFAPDRDLAGATLSMISTEAYAFGLPHYGESIGLEAYGIDHQSTMELISMESMDDDNFIEQLKKARDKAKIDQMIKSEYGEPGLTEDQMYAKAAKDATVRQRIESEFGVKSLGGDMSVKDITKMATDITNLAVGKIVEVSISENGQTAKIPITIRLRVTGMAPSSLVETLSVNSRDNSAKHRKFMMRAGDLSFMDAIFARDRIMAHKQAAMKDASGYYSTVAKRVAGNVLTEALTGKVSVGTASSIIVMTEQTKQELERTLGNKLSNFRAREAIFQSTYAMLIAVMDPEWETVTIYHAGIEMPTNLSAKDIKAAGRGTGPDVAEVLKAYQLGNAPVRL